MLLSLNCKLFNRKATISQQEARETIPFFLNAGFKTDSFIKLTTNSPEKLIAILKKNLAPEYYLWAFDKYYTHIPNSISDSTVLKFIDAFDNAFKNDSIHVLAEYFRGDIFTYNGQIALARKYLNNSSKICFAINDKNRAADAICLLGKLESIKGNFNEAAKHTFDALYVYNTLDSKENEVRQFETILRIGGIYTKIKNYTEANTWYVKAWQFANVHERQEKNK